jgi:hypothetical protein
VNETCWPPSRARTINRRDSKTRRHVAETDREQTNQFGAILEAAIQIEPGTQIGGSVRGIRSAVSYIP